MIWYVILLFVVGVFLSAFFSGSETGFYRASRIRFLMDGLDGDPISRRMIWLFNNPSMFVATTLVGNNVANYFVSMSVVLMARYLFPSVASAELLAPIAMSPVLFVYGESLPKSIFFMAPNRLLKLAAPLFLFFTLLFAPVALVLWSLARLVERMLGASPEKVRFMLARRELQNVLLEGQEAGILHASQRLLGQNFFIEASKPVSVFCTPIARIKALRTGTSPAQALKFAQRNQLAEVPLFENSRSRIKGYVRTIDLIVKGNPRRLLHDPLPLRTVQASELYGEVLLQMHSRREPLTLVIDSSGKPLGLLSLDQLTDPLLTGALGSLRR